MDKQCFDLAVIIPACNEEAFIGRCLSAVLGQTSAVGRLQIIVAMNACNDGTKEIVQEFVPRARALGWVLVCDISESPGKIEALNRADMLVDAPIRIYLDADVICNPELLSQIRVALDRTEPRYATGTLEVSPARSWITRSYAKFWKQLPFVQGGTVGAGMFAVNAAGRKRWGVFPSIISDDTFVRRNFVSSERIEVQARYYWPMVEGLSNLVTVRRRQDAGVTEVYRLFPALRKNEAKIQLRSLELVRLTLSNPVGFVVYLLVHLLVRLGPSVTDWSRGR